MTLADYVSRSGITTYEKLLIVCERQFVLPPERAMFDEIVGHPKSNPAEGVAVILPDDDIESDGPEFPTTAVQKLKRRKQGIPMEPVQAPHNAATEEHVRIP